jgi:hypothetical protein
VSRRPYTQHHARLDSERADKCQEARSASRTDGRIHYVSVEGDYIGAPVKLYAVYQHGETRCDLQGDQA